MRQTGKFENQPLMDISSYEPDNVEHVGWFYIPMQEGKAVCMKPYHSQNTDIDLISYVVPMYKDCIMIGIVGVDIDYSFIKQRVDDISLYFTGYAYLTDSDLNTIYNKKNGIRAVNDYWESLTVARDLEENGVDTLYGYYGKKKNIELLFRN